MGFTIISISISLVAVFIPIFFMPGVIGLLFREFAVIVGLAVLVSAAVSLTLVPMLCSRLLKGGGHLEPHEMTWIGRRFEAAVHQRAQRLRAQPGPRAAAPLPGADAGRRHPGADHRPVFDHAEGLLPRGRPGPVARHRRGVRRHLLGQADGTARQGRRCDARQQARAERHLVHRRRQYRPHVPGAAAARRASGDAGRARRTAQGHAQHRRRAGVHGAGAEPAIGRTAEQEPLPVLAAKRVGRTDRRLGRPVPRAHAQQSEIPRRHQRLAEQGPAGHARHRPRQGGPARRPDGRRAHRALRHLRRAPGLDHLFERGQLLRDPGSGRGRPLLRRCALARSRCARNRASW